MKTSRIALPLFGVLAVLIMSGTLLSHSFIDAKSSPPKKTIDQRITALERELADLKKKVTDLSKNVQNANSGTSNASAASNGITKSKEELLPDIVSKASPSVVSVVISKDVPLLELVYTNPFKNDPRYKGFDIRVPTYRQKGVEKKKVGAGTGFIVTADGYIVTNKHVVADEGATYTVLLSDGKKQEAKVFYRDPNDDIAVIKIDGKYKAVPLGDSDKLQLGQTVVAIGNALGEFDNTISMGIISGLKRSLNASAGNGKVETLKDVIQTDAAINPGNSGGPLLDINGTAIGVNVATVTGSQSIGFAIPINRIRDVISLALGR